MISRGSLALLSAKVLGRLFPSGGIVAYHGVVENGVSPEMHVSPARLREHLEFLREEFHVIPLQELLDRIAQGRPRAGLAAITFDDAYCGVVRLAAPILAELDLPATLFVVSGAARELMPFWWDVAEDVCRRELSADWRSLLESAELPVLPCDTTSLRLLRTRVLARFHGRFPGAGINGYEALSEDLQPASFATLRELARDERFEFGCHTTSHPALPLLSPIEQEREIRDNFRRLAQELPRVRPVIAYPYGLFNDTTVDAARRAGMRFGVTADGRAPERGVDLMRIPRLGVQELRPNHSISLRLNFGLRRLHIMRDGGPHLKLPVDPCLAS